MKIYELKLMDGGKGVYKVSVVKDPAIESTLLYFNKENPEVSTFSDEERKVIYSVVMRPNKLIFRKDINGEPAKVYYTSDTVEKAQINYFRNNGNIFTNINHSETTNASGIFPFESWIVKDSKNDKSTLIGMDTKDGDWVMAYKVDDENIWENYIKTGKLDGLSIEATHLEHEFKKEINMTAEVTEEKSDLQKILDFIFMRTEKQAADPTLEEEDPKKEEDMAEDPKEEVPTEVETPTEEADPKDEEPTEKEQMLMDEIVSLKGTIAQLQADKVKAETDLETMSKQTPAAEPIKNAPTPEKVKSYEDMNNFEKLKFNRENK